MRQGPFAVLTLAAAVLMFPAAAQAQFKIGGGPSFPTGDFGDEAINGYTIHASVGYSPDVLPFGLRLDYFYADFKNVEREPSLDVSLGGEWFRQSGVMLNALYSLSVGPAAPYALVGVGFVHEWHNDRAYFGTSQNTFNLNAGVGLDVLVTDRVGLFVEARQVNVTGSSELPLRAPAVLPEVAFRSIPLTIGVRF